MLRRADGLKTARHFCILAAETITHVRSYNAEHKKLGFV